MNMRVRFRGMAVSRRRRRRQCGGGGRMIAAAVYVAGVSGWRGGRDSPLWIDEGSQGHEHY